MWNKIEYNGFKTLELLEASGFITFKTIIPKHKARFYNYYLDKYVYPVSIFIIILQNEKGIETHKIDNDFKNNIQYYFNYIDNNIKVKGGFLQCNIDKEHNEIINVIKKDSFVSFVIDYTKKIKIHKNLIIKPNPKDYLSIFMKKYYSMISLRNKNLLLGYENNITKNTTYIKKLHFNNKKNTKLILVKKEKDLIPHYLYNILHLYFMDEHNFNNICIIDLTYESTNFEFIEKRLRKYYEGISNFLIERNFFVTNKIHLVYNPLYNKSKEELIINYNDFFNDLMSHIKNKKNFVILNGTLEYYNFKAISYYTEQVYSILFFCQIYYLLNIIEEKGSFISYTYTICTKINQDLIKILNKYFDKIIFHKEKKFKGNFMYIIGKKFKGISNMIWIYLKIHIIIYLIFIKIYYYLEKI